MRPELERGAAREVSKGGKSRPIRSSPSLASPHDPLALSTLRGIETVAFLEMQLQL